MDVESQISQIPQLKQDNTLLLKYLERKTTFNESERPGVYKDITQVYKKQITGISGINPVYSRKDTSSLSNRDAESDFYQILGQGGFNVPASARSYPTQGYSNSP